MLFTVFSRMKSEKFIVGKIFIFTTQDETEIKLFALKRWGCRIILCDVLEAHELTKSHALPGLLCTETFCLLFSAVNVLIALYCATPGLVVYYTWANIHFIAKQIICICIVFSHEMPCCT